VKRERSTPRHQTRCAHCGELTPNYNMVSCDFGDKVYQSVCGQCFNAEGARQDGLTGFQDAKFEPVSLVDSTGKAHKFYFTTRLFGPGIAVDSFELLRGAPTGYRFQIIGKPDDDLLILLGRLIEKMRRALAVKHIELGEYGFEIKERQVRGLIEANLDDEDRMPMLVIDGRAVTWDDFGRMLMQYEGFQFNLKIRDHSDEF
jgi:hypothetical protein